MQLRSRGVGAAAGSEAASERRPRPAARAAAPPRGHRRLARCSPGPARLGAPHPSPTSAPAPPQPLRLLRRSHCTVRDGRDEVAPPLEAARPRDALGCRVDQGGEERGAHARGGGPGKAPRPSSRFCCPRRAPLFLADPRPSGGADSWGWAPPLAWAHLCPFLRHSPVGHPHLLHGSGPQSLGSWEMPDPTCEACVIDAVGSLVRCPARLSQGWFPSGVSNRLFHSVPPVASLLWDEPCASLVQRLK